MKKKYLTVFALFLLLVLTLVCQTACENETPPGNPESTGEQQVEKKNLKAELLEKYPNGSLDVNPEDFAFFQNFDLPLDFRQAVIDKMTEQSLIEWKATSTFTIDKQPSGGGWKFENKYVKGKTYTGLPYCHTFGTLEYFRITMDDQGTPDGFGIEASRIDWNEAPLVGVECVSSIITSVEMFKPIYGDSRLLWCANDLFAGRTVGDFTHTKGQKSADITKANGQTKMAECYALLQPGDVIQTYNATNHSRVVKKVEVSYKNTEPDKVDPTRSYVYCIEQTDTFDPTRKDGVNTNWWVDHKYKFADLFSTTYLPITFAEYDDNKSIIPYIALDKIPDIAKGNIDAVVSSDYPLRFIDIKLYNEDGSLNKTIKSTSIFTSTTMEYQLRKNALGTFADMEVGKTYRYVVKAGIAHGDATVLDVTFKYEGK